MMRAPEHWHPFSVFAAALLAIALTVRAGEPIDVSTPAIRIVSCDAKVQSRKRGVCANALSDADFKALSPGVSWWYNWGADPDNYRIPAGVPMEFRPMAWGDAPGSLDALRHYLAAGKKPRFVLGINEPNLRGQAFIRPEQAAELYARIRTITDEYGIPLVAPQMAIGSKPTDSIRAFDPIEHKTVTYTFMIPYLKAFRFYLKEKHPSQSNIAAIGIHTYDNIYGLKALVELAHRETGLPVWVTEYASLTSDQRAQREFLVQATDYLERTPYVAGYAWFKERVSDPKWSASLLDPESGQLSSLGKAYVALPVHDADLYYRLPGRLPATNYATMSDGEIWPDPDKDDSAYMSSNKSNAEFDYHVIVDKPGAYLVQISVKGPAGTITLIEDHRSLTTFSLHDHETSWATVPASVALKPGPQTISLQFDHPATSLAWIEFHLR
jgi:hypothetical protein